MNYQQTLQYLYNELPMFQRAGPPAYKANLDNTLSICNLLGNPQDTFKSIHIAGTNGKGSTSHMLAAILQTAGYKVGLYTSPHLKDFRERIRINGRKISKRYVINFVRQYQKNFERIKPSFFEMTVGLAFSYFKDEKIDIAVIETGLGGRLDSTNIITPILSVITNIGYDHQSLLGDTLEKIAKEKAGIIKPRIPIIIGELNETAEKVFITKAKEVYSPIYFASRNFQVTECFIKKNKLAVTISNKSSMIFKNLCLDLTGLYQTKNIITVIQSVFILKNLGFKILKEHFITALKKVKKLTGLKGRWNILGKRPLIVCDTAHNIDGVKEIKKQIETISFSKLHVVLGMVKDKDVGSILELFPSSAKYYFCKADLPRSLEPAELFYIAQQYNLNGEVYSSVKDAIEAAKKSADHNDMIFIGGSTFVVAEAL